MDVLLAIGGLLGALGGPAGLWAAWNQRQESKHREEKEQLAKLREHVLRLRRIGSEGARRYRDHDWWNRSGGLEARNAIVELRPYIKLKWPKLEAALLEATWSYYAAAASVIERAPGQDRSSVEREQSQHADLLAQQANDVAVQIHDL